MDETNKQLPLSPANRPAPSPEIAAPAVCPTMPQKKARPIPRKIKAAIEAVQSGKAKNWTAGAKAAGISREYLSRTLSARPDIIEWAQNRAKRLMALGVCIATPKMIELVHSNSQRVAFEASRHIQACAGIKPAADANMSVSIELKAGYVIDLSGRNPGDRAGAKVIEYEAGRVIGAKPEPIAGIGPDGERKPD
jgi:hypothetical protein